MVEKTISGQGISFVSKSLVFERLKEGSLINLFGYSARSPISLFLVAPARNFQWEKVKKFEEWLKTLLNYN